MLNLLIVRPSKQDIVRIIKLLAAFSMVGIFTGIACFIFLKSLAFATDMRFKYPYLLFFLPLGGALVTLMYQYFGKNAAKGNNLVIEQVHDKSENIPFRMAPFVLIGTVITHLFGGSAGREGTAIQLGGSIAEQISKLFKVDLHDRKLLIMSGISGGFGAVFGTPLAGTIFGIEVIALGSLRYEALLPCFISSFVGDATARWLGITHSHWNIENVPDIGAFILIKVIIASITFAITSIIFCKLIAFIKKMVARLNMKPYLKTSLGGVAIIILTYIVGSREYLGLSLELLNSSIEGSVRGADFLLKLIFTSVTLGTGFQGGEVTPLFVIGASLGSALGNILAEKAAFFAALGMVAVFCGATNTPIASFILYVELFGSNGMLLALVACIISYIFSGHLGIYNSQRVHTPKYKLAHNLKGKSLGEIHNKKKNS